MKKVLTIALAVLLTLPAFSQITVTKQSQDSVKDMTISMQWTWLYHKDNMYFIHMKSTNQFDSPILLFLGDKKEGIIQTLSDLEQLGNTMTTKESLKIKDAGGKPFTVRLAKELGVKVFHFYTEDRAGFGYLQVSKIKDVIDYVCYNL